MMTCTRILSVEYYESMARQIKREAGLDAVGATLDDTAAAYARNEAVKGHKEGSQAYEAAYTEAFDRALRTLRKGHSEGRDQVAYYTDNGAGEANGVWWTRGLPEAEGASPAPRPIPSPFRHCTDGAEVDGRVLRDLAEGRDPETRDPLVRQSANGKRSVGYDVQFAAPKSVSVLAAFAEPDVRAKIMAAHDRAVRRAMDHAFDAGLIVTRTGEGGKVRSPVEETSAAVYRHFTSRAQDPQLHSHVVLLNLAVRNDGRTGSIDNKDILRNAGGIAALYRSELASELRRELGVEAVRDGRNFEVAGIPPKVLDLFSKRRAEIEKAARESGFDTARNRGAAQVAAFETREAKDKDVSLTALEQRWVRELDNAGWNPETLFRIARVEAERIRSERDDEGESRNERLMKLALAGVSAVTKTEAVIEERHLFRYVAEALQCDASADEVVETVERLKASGRLVQLGNKAGEPAYSTEELVEAEKAMLRAALAREDEREFVPAATLERVLAARTTMRDEQRAAVRHALNRSGVVVVEGSAGSGKSFAMRSVADAARDAGAEVWTIAPSWKAVDVIRTDTETAEEMARAVNGFLNRVRSGKIELGPNAVIVTDEAGMIGTQDMRALVEAAGQAGAKLVLTGDTRQLAPVVAGAPMRALATALGTSRMEEIQRQRGRTPEEGAWMRVASKDFAAQETVRALEAYDRAGAIAWAEDREEAINALVRDYAEARKDPAREGKSRAVLTGWNVDVQAVNERVRARLIEQGSLPAGQDVEVQAVPRGGSKPVALALRAGDDVIFGESVEVAGQTIRNADLARIVHVEGAGPDTRLTLTLAKNGATVTVRASELVGFREEGEARHPKMQHSYAMTVHASQGVTVDECYVLNTRGMQAENTYVAMTRHRETVRLYADTSRIRDSLEARQTLSVSPEHRGMGGAASQDQAPEVTAAEVRAAFIAESAIKGGKANASDFLSEDTNLRDWAHSPPGLPRQPASDFPASPAEDTPPPPARDVQEGPFKPRLPVRPLPPRVKVPGREPEAAPPPAQTPAPPTTSQRASDALRERMQARAKSPNAYPAPAGGRERFSKRITEAEFDAFRRIDLAEFAMREGLVPLGQQEASKQHPGMSFRLYRDPTKADGSKVNIAQWPGGKWSFTARDGTVSGDITRFISWRDGCTSIEAAHRLRAYLGTKPSGQAPVTEASRAPVVREDAGRRAGLAQAPETATAGGSDRSDAERRTMLERMQRVWHVMGKDRAPNGYLLQVRDIAREVLDRFRNDIRTTRDGHAAFAHRDLEGRITGFEVKGAGDQDGGRRSVSRFSADTEKNFTQLGDTRAPLRIYVAESAVDGLSIYQADGQPQRALIASFYGQPSGVALDRFRELVRRHPAAEVHVAMDNDTSGRSFAAQVEEKVQQARGPEAGIHDRRPDAAYKDWNDQIRGWTQEDAAGLRAEREAEVKAREERERAATEAARLRVEVEVAQARPRLG